jgi:hypothetical protein
MECAVADLARKLTILPVGHPQRPGLIEMIAALSAEILIRERGKITKL